ncbi:MAG: helix-turn-helix domain-containing protein [Thiobacillus sp.]|nr:helix-turn-helix domain-containing protein [Thiobacillus sp.]
MVIGLDQTNSRVHQALLRRWQNSVDQADHFITALSTGPAEARMARLLITLGCTGDQPETLPSREDMGALVGITTETASRIMAEFKRRGLIHTDRGGEVVCDHAGLAILANG